MKVTDSVILADPGILFPLIFNIDDIKEIKKNLNLCIIPHYIDKDDLLIRNNIRVNKSFIINIEDDPFQFFNSLLKCKRVLSSSLHGLIISDSFGIPNMRMIVSNKITGGDYKFKNYYSAYGIKAPLEIDIRKTIFTENQLYIIDSNYKISMDLIKKKQCQLIINFPYNLNKKFKLYKKSCKKNFKY